MKERGDTGKLLERQGVVGSAELFLKSVIANHEVRRRYFLCRGPRADNHPIILRLFIAMADWPHPDWPHPWK